MKYRILKEKEYEACKLNLPNPGRRFWVEKDEGKTDTRCSFVNEEGQIDRFGTFGSDTTLWMRPVIEYDPGEKKEIEFKEGQQVLLHGLEWTAISDNILVCDRCVEQVKFDDSTRDFDNSYLKYALYQYFKRRIAAEETGENSGTEIIEADEDKETSSGTVPNIFFLLLAVTSGALAAAFFSPVSVILSAVAVGITAGVMSSYNKKKIKEAIKNAKKKGKKAVAKVKQATGEPSVEESGFHLTADNITDPVIKEKTDKINNLIDGVMKTENRTAQAKVKFFYLPETQKTLELYYKLTENGIETPNTKECMDIISENLDKTIKLLTIEYDKAVSDSLLDAQMSQGIIGKMLDNAENEEQSKIVLK